MFSSDVRVDLDIAKDEDAADPRRPGRCCTWVPQAPANTEDAASYGFPEG